LHSDPLEHLDDAKRMDPSLTVLATSPEAWQDVRNQSKMFASSFPYAATRISNEGDFDKRSSVTGRMAPAAYCSRPLGLAYGLWLSGDVPARPVSDRAALAERPTTMFHEAVTKGMSMSYLGGSFPDMMTALGGVPVSVNDRLIGGSGYSEYPYFARVTGCRAGRVKERSTRGCSNDGSVTDPR
jgi:hypothetical protein